MKRLKLNIQLFASGSASKTVYSPASSSYGYVITSAFNENSTNTNANTSNVTVTATLRGDKINFSVTNGGTLAIYWVDNNSNSGNGRLVATKQINSTTKGTTYTASGTIDVGHKADGTLAGYAKTVWTKNAGSYVPPTTTVTTANTNLTTIPRANSVSAGTGTIGGNLNITIGKSSSSFTTTLTYVWGGLTGTIVTKTGNTSYSWTIPTSFYSQIPNVQYGTGTITAITYNGNTEVGRSSTSFRGNANENDSKPTISILDVVDTNPTTIALTGDENVIVKGYSTAYVTISRATKNYASLKYVSINGYEIGTSATSRTITNVNTNTFNARVTDSRGYFTDATPVVKSGTNFVDYVPLAISASFTRNTATDGKVNLKYSGSYFNGSFGDVDNSLIVRYRYKQSDSSTFSEWTTLTPTISGNTFSQTIQLNGIFDYREPFDFELQAFDQIFTSGVNYSQQIPSGVPVYWWNKDSFTINTDFYLGSFLTEGCKYEKTTNGWNIKYSNGFMIQCKNTWGTPTNSEANGNIYTAQFDLGNWDTSFTTLINTTHSFTGTTYGARAYWLSNYVWANGASQIPTTTYCGKIYIGCGRNGLTNSIQVSTIGYGTWK